MQLPKVQQLGLGRIADPARSAMTCTVLLARAANAAPVELAGAIVHDRERQRPANGRAASRRLNLSGLCFCLCLTRQHKQHTCRGNLSPRLSHGRSGLANLPACPVLLMVRLFKIGPTCK
jgi:hypothetical protein